MNNELASQARCHLLQNKKVHKNYLLNDLEGILSFIEESHLIQRLLKCKVCGQLFLFTFQEEIDWIDGNDPQYREWIPVRSINNQPPAEGMTTDMFEPMYDLKLIRDWPKDMPIAPEYATIFNV